MNYEYVNNNLLDTPTSYSFSAYGGEQFMSSYRESRLRSIYRLQGIDNHDKFEFYESAIILRASEVLSARLNINNTKLFGDVENAIRNYGNKTFISKNCRHTELCTFSLNNTTNTHDLLIAILKLQLKDNAEIGMQKHWIDLLLQRFEVTKKIFEQYLPGFRTGVGDPKKINLYITFALSLSLIYLKTYNLKYLNSILKICDLLCSLPKEILCYTSVDLMEVVVKAEVIFVKQLAAKKKVSLE